MTLFDRAFEWVLAEEGPPTNDPADPGGYTLYGIAQRYHPQIDVRSLTLEKARAIYRSDYWDAVQAEQLPRVLALVTFDAAVQHSPTEAVKLLQAALRVEDDGVLGPVTLAAARAARAEAVPRALGLRARRYHQQVELYPYKAKWLNGWLIRLFELQAWALEVTSTEVTA